MNYSEILAKHIVGTRFADIPSDVIDTAKKSYLDALGVMLAASSLGDGCDAFVKLAVNESNKEESTVIGYGKRVERYWAAFANGSLAHALDYEDTHDIAHVHPNAAVIPAALALAESIKNIDGKSFLTAIVLGAEVVCRLGLCLLKDPIIYGWYMPPILNAFGSTVASCKILNASEKQVLDALSLTLLQATCTAEIARSEGSVLRAVRDAFAAKAGILSALLSVNGVTGVEQAFEGKAGLFELYSRGNYNASKLTESFGNKYEILNISFKPWPSCRGTHAFIEAILNLIKKYEVKPVDIERILITINDKEPVVKELCLPLDKKICPATSIEAKFSIPYTIAVAVVNGNITLKDFMRENLCNKEVLSIASKITLEINPDFDIGEGTVAIKLRDSDILREEKLPCFALGHPSNPLKWEDIIKKFRSCAFYSRNPLSNAKLDRLIEKVMKLEKITDVSEIVI